jgi:hypothetical protein
MLTPIGGNLMALAKVENQLMENYLRKRMSTDAITRAYFRR